MLDSADAMHTVSIRCLCFLGKSSRHFDEHKEQLLAEVRGRFVFIKGSDFASHKDALYKWYRRFGNKEFLVR